MPDGGQYTLSVTAADANNNPITATVSSFGTVDGVNITPASTSTSSTSAPTSAQTNLDVDGVSVALSELMANPTFTPGN